MCKIEKAIYKLNSLFNKLEQSNAGPDNSERREDVAEETSACTSSILGISQADV
jgi:hypothetical protein